MVGGYRFPTAGLAAIGLFGAVVAAFLAGGGWTRRLALLVAAVAVWTVWSVVAV